jgi:predicted transposase YbfD/YdcC
MLCGYRSYSAISEWGRNYGQIITSALGFPSHLTPCAATFHNVLRRIDKDSFEQKLATYFQAQDLSAHNPNYSHEGVSIDGKTLRGSKKQGATQASLLSALSHTSGLTLAQTSVPEKTNEIKAFKKLLSLMNLKGKVITTDALLTQREICRMIVGGKGDYLMRVKQNQEELLGWVRGVFEEMRCFREEATVAESIEEGHGRIERRKITASSVLSDHNLWPGLNQCIRIEKEVIEKKSGKRSKEEGYAITSLSREEAKAGRLQEIIRGHWGIENKSHWVRDVTYDEDRSQVRSGSIGEVMAGMRNAVIGLMRRAGETNIARACRRYAAQPWEALALIGIKT